MICKTYIKIKAFFGICFVFFLLISENGCCVSNKIIYLNKQQTLAYYQMMKDINELFEKFEITFWPIAGTLLGAVRNGGLIPWDIDMDIGIFEYDAYKLKEVEPYLNKLQYSLKQKGNRPVWLVSADGIHMDIVAFSKVDNRIFYTCPYLQKILPKREGMPLYIDTNEFFPLKKYPFGSLQVPGPSNPLPYLFTAYGKNCLTHGAPHSYPPSTEHEFLLNDTKPAEPFGPLLDRVVNL